MKQNPDKYNSVIFIHVPKAAGSTLSAVVRRQYPKSATFTTDPRNVRKSIKDFKNLPEFQRQQFMCLKGNMHFGLHKYLPQPCGYFTFLREPVDRIISHYYYVLRTPHHYLYEQVTKQNMSLDDYAGSGISPELDNGQTRMLAGIPGNRDDEITPEILETAKQNLQNHFVVVGLTERFDESLILLKRRLRWGDVCYKRWNTTAKRPSVATIPESTIQLIKDTNDKDLELYAFARLLFDEMTQAEGLSFKLELMAFRLFNAVHQKAGGHFIRKRFRNLRYRLQAALH